MENNSISDLISEYKKAIMSEKIPFFECNHCSHKFPYPRICCNWCGSKDIGLELAGGNGKIHAMTILHRVLDRSLKVPFYLLMVELAEGVRVMANSTSPPNFEVGDRVTVRVDLTSISPRLVAQPA